MTGIFVQWSRIHSDTRGWMEDGSGCWLWTGAMYKNGYGYVYVLGRNRTGAHRAVYEKLVGPIPRGLVLDHLCRNPRCVNPGHLEVVTRRVNNLRGVGINARYAARTHCDRGHLLPVDRVGFKQCRECLRWHDRKRFHENPARRASMLEAAARYRQRRKAKKPKAST